LANFTVFVVGQVPAATAAAVPVPDAAALVVELLELHAAVNASSAITKRTDNLRTTCIPPQRPLPEQQKADLSGIPHHHKKSNMIMSPHRRFRPAPLAVGMITKELVK
jgi:hypothetical protein